MSCGTCTFCCTQVGVRELGKPKGIKCRHETESQGCAIYPERPKSCRMFNCLWLVSRQWKIPLPDWLRPDKCKTVVVLGADCQTLVIKGEAGGAFRNYVSERFEDKLRLLFEV